MERSRFVLALFVLLLAGCATRTEREALRQCSFAPLRAERLGVVGDTLRLALLVQVSNPGPSAAVVDSFRATVLARSPLATLSHGKAQRIAPGASDTVRIGILAENSTLLGKAATLLFSPPDSLRLEGQAWIPGPLWTHRKEFRWAVPWSSVAPSLQGVFGQGI